MMGMGEVHAASMSAEREDALDNGFADSADLDVCEPTGLVEEAQEPALSFGERRQILEDAVCRHPLNREPLYKILVLCLQEQPLIEIERQVAEFPEFKRCTLSQHEMVRVLERAYGLTCIERDADGIEIDDARKEGLSEDEIDDLVASCGYVTTPEGVDVVERHKPSARIAELMEKHPDQAELTLDLMKHIQEEPCSYLQVQKLLKGNPALVVTVDGRRSTLQPSVILDRLCRAGAIEFRDGWHTTAAGEEYLRG